MECEASRETISSGENPTSPNLSMMVAAESRNIALAKLPVSKQHRYIPPGREIRPSGAAATGGGRPVRNWSAGTPAQWVTPTAAAK